MIIYQITNKVNHESYIGKTTKSLNERFKRHTILHKKGNTHLYRAMRKYGIENFCVEQISECLDLEDLNQKEKYYISTLQPKYNMTKGGDGGNTSNSPNYKVGMSKRNTFGKNNPMFGKKRDNSSITPKATLAAKIANRCPVSCETVIFDSVGAAEKFYGRKIRHLLDNPSHPSFFRLRERTLRK